MATILMVEDDNLITEPVENALVQAGFDVLVAHDGKLGLEMALNRQPDLLLLDIMLPGMNGWDICRALRAKNTVPIVMITALNDEVDRILGLELGADDYITKPFSTRELVARVRATLRRVELDTMERKPGNLKIGSIHLDLDARRAFKGDTELFLRYKEFELLTLLMGRAGEAVSRAELFDEIWGMDWIGDTRTLDVHIRWLREKLEENPGNPDYIQTVRGVGYRFVSPDEAP